ncbi:MAG: hypothetical protein AABY83_05955 [Pseudomonadota bacterium]
MKTWSCAVWMIAVLTGAIVACAQAGAQRDSISIDKFQSPEPPATLPVVSPAAQQVLRALQGHAAAYGLSDPHAQLKLVDEQTDTQGRKHLRFMQIQEGVPVWGGQLLVQMETDGSLEFTNNALVRLSKQISVHPRLTPPEAHAAAQRIIGEGWQADTAELFIYAVGDDVRLIYNIALTQGFYKEIYFIDAQTGVLVKRFAGIQSTR